MRAVFLLPLLLSCSGIGLAQTATPPQAPASQGAASAPAPGRPDQRIERIRHEDDGARIDELRVGGETKQITVQPKGGMPAYEVNPDNATQQPGQPENQGATGRRGWKILGF
jgi:hypothetical protein